MEYTKKEYQEFYNKVGSLIGWDFSSLKYSSEGVEWELYEVMQQRCRQTDILLDIGTGGGERILKVASKLQFVFGIDISPAMIATARKNRIDSGINNVRFFEMDAQNIQFPKELFQIVTCRHSDFDSNEVFRVLEKGGCFLTQQVGEADQLDIKNEFGRGQSYGIEDGTAMREYVHALNAAGFPRIEMREYNAVEYYSRPEDLIFLLSHTPVIPYFGEAEDDFEVLERYINKNFTPKGIRTNSKRYLIIAEK